MSFDLDALLGEQAPEFMASFIVFSDEQHLQSVGPGIRHAANGNESASACEAEEFRKCVSKALT